MGAFDAFLGGFSGAALGRVLVEVGLNTTAMERGLATTQANLQTSGQKMGSALKSAITVGATIAAAAVVKFGVDAVKAFQESEAVIAQTAAVLKSTGGAAGVTAQQVDTLATSLQHASLFTDEEVASAENLLLTFRNIGENIFPQTTQAVLDMSAALGQDLKSSSIQLGKALNDPLVGLTALRRVGVTFSEDQVALITRLVQTNDLLGAQKVILNEVTTEFGGSAQAAEDAQGPFADIADSLDAFQEAAGGAIVGVLKPLVPLFAGLLQVITPLIPALEALLAGFVAFKVVSAIPVVIQAMARGFIALQTAMGTSAATAANTFVTFGKLQASALAFASAAAGPVALGVIALTIGFANLAAQQAKAKAEFDSFLANADQVGTTFNDIIQSTQDAGGQIDLAAVAVERLKTKMESLGIAADPVSTALQGIDAALSAGSITLQDAEQDYIALGLSTDDATKRVNYFANAVEQHLTTAGKAVRNFAGLTGKELKSFQADLKDSIGSTLGDVSGFSAKWEQTGQQFARTVDQMRQKAKVFARDLKQLDRASVPEDFQKWLLEQGPDAVHAFEEGTKKMQQGVVQDFRGIQAAIKQSGTSIDKITRGAEDLGNTKFSGKLGSQFDSVWTSADRVRAMLDTLQTKLSGLDGSVVHITFQETTVKT